MAIDTAVDDLVPITDVCKRFPNEGRPRNIRTVMRWVLTGCVQRHGSEPVKLEAVRVGGNWYTTKDAIREFTERLTAQAGPQPSRSTRRTSSKRKDRALARLKAKGIGKGRA